MEQANSNNSIPIQSKKFQTFCSTNSLRQLKTFVDKQSARTAHERPQFQEMLAYCRKNHKDVSCVVVADLSRLARNVVDQGSSIAELKKLGIKTVSIDEPMVDDTAAGKLAGNILATFNQFFSDSLSERTKYRMAAAVREGRFVWPSPIGYLNVDKNLVVDPERAPLVRKAFELFVSGAYTGDGVLRLVTAMGLTTKKGRPLTKQSFARLLQNEIYTGWIVSGESRVRGKHEPIVSEEVFQAVQDRLNGKSRPHTRLSEDFPLRGFVRCIQCGKNLTAGWAKGREEPYPHYWCWTKGCSAVKAGRDAMDHHWLTLLSKMRPTEELLEQLPTIAARQWETRKGRIAKDAEALSKRLADQTTLNQKLITAKLNGEISQEDFDTMKASISAEKQKIIEQVNTLDTERSAMQDLMKQAKQQTFNFVAAWHQANVNQKQELAKGLFPDGLMFSMENKFFEPANEAITALYVRTLQDFAAGKDLPIDIGVPDGI